MSKSQTKGKGQTTSSGSNEVYGTVTLPETISMPRPRLYNTPEEKKVANREKSKRHYHAYIFYCHLSVVRSSDTLECCRHKSEIQSRRKVKQGKAPIRLVILAPQDTLRALNSKNALQLCDCNATSPPAKASAVCHTKTCFLNTVTCSFEYSI